MRETLKQIPWRQFYEQRMAEAQKVITNPESSTYDKIVASESFEADTLKVAQNERREAVMNNGEPLNTMQIKVSIVRLDTKE